MTTPVPTLTLSDRCDQCTAAAYVQVIFLVKEKVKDCDLLFCAHHFNHHEAVLLTTGGSVLTDNRKQLQGEAAHV